MSKLSMAGAIWRGELGIPVYPEPEAYISREKLYSPRFMVQWKWLYSVEIGGSAPVAIGTLLSEAKAWAKRRGAKSIKLAWEAA